jgi:hypothetical protein
MVNLGLAFLYIFLTGLLYNIDFNNKDIVIQELFIVKVDGQTKPP